MSTQTVPVVQKWLRHGTEYMRLQCDDILALGDSMTYSDRVAIRDGAAETTGWRRHWYRVLRQHHDAGWPIPEAWADYQAYDIALNNWITMISEHLGMTVPQRQDPEPKAERILKPGEMTASQKAGWLGSAILFALVTGFAILVSNLTPSSPSGNGPGPGLAIEAGYLFWFLMTCWWAWAGHHEKTHPKFAAARVVVGSAGVALLAKKAHDAHQGTQERLKNGGYGL